MREQERWVEKQKEREREMKEETGGRQSPPFKREYRDCIHKVLLVAEFEDVFCQDLKCRPI